MTLQIAVQYRVITDSNLEPVAGKAAASNQVSPVPDMERDTVENSGVWRAFYRLTDIEQQLRPYVEDTVRSEIPKRKLDEAYEEKEAVAIAVKQTLEVRRCPLPAPCPLPRSLRAARSLRSAI